MSTMLSRSSTDPNSTTILPFRLPRLTVTRVSKESERRLGNVLKPGHLNRLAPRGQFRARAILPVGESDGFFGRADGQSFGDDTGRQILLRVGSGVQGQQSACMAGRQTPAATRRCTGSAASTAGSCWSQPDENVRSRRIPRA